MTISYLPNRNLPAEEVQRRLASVRTEMEKSDVDMLYCYADCWRTANVRYFTEFRPVDGIHGIEQALLAIPMDGDPVLFVSDGTLADAKTKSHFEARSLAESKSFMQRKVKRYEVAGRDLMPTDAMQWFMESMAINQLPPSSSILARVKAVKSDWELTQLRAAARLTDLAMETVQECVASGGKWTERDLAREADAAMIQAGADSPAYLSMIQSGPRSGFSLGLPTDRVLQPGELVLTDIGARYGHYVADGGRGFTLGEVSQRIADIVDASVTAVQTGIDHARPGISAHELNAAIQQVLVERGYAAFSGEAAGRGTGHGTGMDPEEEEPWIGPGNDLELQPGMVCTIKATINVPDVGGLRTEHIVHITESGCELLDEFPMRNHW